jgi:hypothetical protein
MKLPVTLTNPFGALKKEQAPFTTIVPPLGLESEHVPLLTSPGRKLDPVTLT